MTLRLAMNLELTTWLPILSGARRGPNPADRTKHKKPLQRVL